MNGAAVEAGIVEMCITGRIMELWETLFAGCGKALSFPCPVNGVFHRWNGLLCTFP